MINNTFQCNDKIEAWTYTTGKYNELSETGYAAVWHPLDNDYKKLKLVHKTRLDKRIRYSESTITLTHSFHVQEGDVIGFHSAIGSIGPLFCKSLGGDHEYDGTDFFKTYVYNMNDENLPLGTIVDQVTVSYYRFDLLAIMERPGKSIMNYPYTDGKALFPISIPIPIPII